MQLVVDTYVDEDGETKPITRELRFIDSFRFMPSRLDKLSKNLHDDQCKNLAKHFSGDKFNLMHRKGMYPYDYIDRLSKLDQAKLPPKQAFYSRLNDQDISDEDYAHAQTVWNKFEMNNFRDYLDLYNVSDVLILADVFENFRDVCIENYGLHPAWYYTSPGLA